MERWLRSGVAEAEGRSRAEVADPVSPLEVPRSSAEGGENVEVVDQGQPRQIPSRGGVGALQECLGDPARVFGRIKASVNGEGLGRAPARQSLNSGRRAASGKQGGGETYSEAVEAVLVSLGFGQLNAKELFQKVVHR